MKKILSIIVLGGFAVLVACGPSAEEKAAAEKARQDSINAVMTQMAADSMAAAQAAIEKARMDSIAMASIADSLAKAEANSKKTASKPKPKPKTQEEKKVEEAKKVTSGRGQ
jgi:outer membrane biosynthesis protein TonB